MAEDEEYEDAEAGGNGEHGHCERVAWPRSHSAANGGHGAGFFPPRARRRRGGAAVLCRAAPCTDAVR